MFRAGGFSIDLTHHAMHAMGSRMLGFSQELFNDQTDTDPQMEAEMFAAMSATYPSSPSSTSRSRTTTRRSSAPDATTSSSSSSRSTWCSTAWNGAGSPSERRPGVATLDDVARFVLGLPEVAEEDRRENPRLVGRWEVVRVGTTVHEGRPESGSATRRRRRKDVAVRVDGLLEEGGRARREPPGLLPVRHFDGSPAVLFVLRKVAAGPLREALVDGWLACAPRALAGATRAAPLMVERDERRRRLSHEAPPGATGRVRRGTTRRLCRPALERSRDRPPVVVRSRHGLRAVRPGGRLVRAEVAGAHLGCVARCSWSRSMSPVMDEACTKAIAPRERRRLIKRLDRPRHHDRAEPWLEDVCERDPRGPARTR